MGKCLKIMIFFAIGGLADVSCKKRLEPSESEVKGGGESNGGGPSISSGPLSLQISETPGDSWEYDQGPSADSKWTDLLGAVSDFRSPSLGGGKLFRWQFGPVLYRGRLTEESVRLLIVGQETALTDLMTGRAFTGPLGGMLQKKINDLGIGNNYLFFNTTAYNLSGFSGQVSESSQVTESNIQEVRAALFDSESAVAKHRHAMLNYALETNRSSLQTVWAVGAIGRDAVLQWLKSISSPDKAAQCISLKKCDVDAILPGLKVVEIPLPKGKRFSERATIPRYDLPFGLPDLLARTTARIKLRRDEAALELTSSVDSPEIKSDVEVRYARVADMSEKPTDLAPWVGPSLSGERMWEFPRGINLRLQFDRGPGPMARLLSGHEPGMEWPDFWALGVKTIPEFGANAIYRGRLDQAKVLIVADQESFDDLIFGRALTGLGGQKVQALLHAMGVNRSYAIIRTLPVDVLDVDASEAAKIALHPQVMKLRERVLNRILEERRTDVVLAIGPMASAVVAQHKKSFESDDQVVIELPRNFHSDDSHDGEWQQALIKIKRLNILTPDDGMTPTWIYKAGQRAPLPRYDFPYQARWWWGSSGNRIVKGIRVTDGEEQTSPAHVKITVPSWIAR